MPFKVISVSDNFERELKKKHREYMIRTGQKITFIKFTDLIALPNLNITKTIYRPQFDWDFKEIKI